VGEVQLSDHDIVAFGGDPEPAAPVAVQQGREHAGTVEPRAAEPVHTAVGRDQRRGLQISNQSVLGDRRVASIGDPPTLTCPVAARDQVVIN
jgi:hypothetical protein